MADVKQTVREWLVERQQNARTIAASTGVSDKAAWLEDADYFRRAIQALDQRAELRALWIEWEAGAYDGTDLLRRVRLAVHGPLQRPSNAGVALGEGGNDGR